jgi:hypothetical protein
MAPFPSSVTRAVNTRTFLACVLYLHPTSSLSDAEWIQLLTSQGASATLAFMQEYWVDINGQNEQFWEVRPVYTSYLLVSWPLSTSGPPMGLATAP